MQLPISAAVTAAMAMLSASSLDVGGKQIEVSETTVPSTCKYNRLLPDPTSSRVVVWNHSRDLRTTIKPTWPSGVHVVDLPPNNSPPTAKLRFAYIHGSTRVAPLRWSSNGDRLLLRADRTGAALYDPLTRKLSRAPELDPLFPRLAVEALSHGDTGFYRQPAMLDLARRIHGESPALRWLANVGPDRTTFLVFRLGNGHRLTGYDMHEQWDTGVPISFAHSALLPAGARRPTFLGDQAGGTSFLAYALPLIDRTTGKIAGRFGLERIELRDGRKIDLGSRLGQLMTVQDATMNGDTIFALVDLEREMRVFRVRGHAIDNWLLCEKTSVQLGPMTIPPENWLPAATPVSRTEVHFARGRGAKNHPFGFLYRPKRSDDRLIVYFHGGPTATLAGTTVPREVHQFAGAGASVLAVEQSGMIGGGLALSERLRCLGHKALREDVAAVTDWVRHSGYRRIYLIADSFGGASGVIAATEHPKAYRHIFLRAPYLAMRAPEQTVNRSTFGQGATPPESQIEFEEMVYGGAVGRERFAMDLRASTARLRPSPQLSLYFGSLDPVSTPSDLPPAFAGHPSIIVVRATHETASVFPEVERDIFAKLGIAPQTRGR